MLGLDLPMKFLLDRVHLQCAIVLFLDELPVEAHSLRQFGRSLAPFLLQQQHLLVVTSALQRVSGSDECCHLLEGLEVLVVGRCHELWVQLHEPSVLGLFVLAPAPIH